MVHVSLLKARKLSVVKTAIFSRVYMSYVNMSHISMKVLKGRDAVA